jgi:SNF2 family DNA or RNA helicase
LEKLRDKGLVVYGAGEDIPDGPAHHCAMSVKAHGTGKNLQQWSNNLLTSFLPNGSTLEQLIGRTHRLGQQADEVFVYYFEQHSTVHNDIEKAREIASYIQETQGNRMKILAASWL